MINLIILIIAIALLIELFYSPRIDETCRGQVLLYYGLPGKRKYIQIWQRK